jgi:hypothetical protein
MEFLRMLTTVASASGDDTLVAHPVAVVLGLVSTWAGSLLAFVQGNDLTALALGVTGLGVAGVAVYQRFRQVRREEDKADIELRAANRQHVIDALTREIETLKNDVGQEHTMRVQMQALAASRQQLIDGARANCPHKDQCPVSQLGCDENEGACGA